MPPPSPAPTDALVARDLTVRRGGRALLDRVSLTVPGGAIYGLLGPNGAGKTTLLRACLHLVRPASGMLRVAGLDPARDLRGVLARVGYVADRPTAPGWMTVARLLRHHAVFHAHWDADYAAVLQRALRVPVTVRAGSLSKGEAARLALLLALAHRPPLLLLDEPTDGLDPVARRDFLALLVGHVSDTGCTVVISSHLIHELEGLADAVGVLDAGRVLAELPMAVFRDSIKRLRVAAGAPPALDGVPLDVLARAPAGRDEVWTVRGWAPGMGDALAGRGVRLLEVTDLGLEDGYVELVRSLRAAPRA